eukprot:SAG22_NODE_305_length_12688_cov_24.723330_6_plen_248_part_01
MNCFETDLAGPDPRVGAQAMESEQQWIRDYLDQVKARRDDLFNEDGDLIVDVSDLQSEMEGKMVEASRTYEAEHGVPFPNIEGTDFPVHQDVGVLFDLLNGVVEELRSNPADAEDQQPPAEPQQPAAEPQKSSATPRADGSRPTFRPGTPEEDPKYLDPPPAKLQISFMSPEVLQASRDALRQSPDTTPARPPRASLVPSEASSTGVFRNPYGMMAGSPSAFSAGGTPRVNVDLSTARKRSAADRSPP